jgi:hypothetical protein
VPTDGDTAWAELASCSDPGFRLRWRAQVRKLLVQVQLGAEGSTQPVRALMLALRMGPSVPNDYKIAQAGHESITAQLEIDASLCDRFLTTRVVLEEPANTGLLVSVTLEGP